MHCRWIQEDGNPCDEKVKHICVKVKGSKGKGQTVYSKYCSWHERLAASKAIQGNSSENVL
jgi:hypothetical protein